MSLKAEGPGGLPPLSRCQGGLAAAGVAQDCSRRGGRAMAATTSIAGLALMAAVATGPAQAASSRLARCSLRRTTATR